MTADWAASRVRVADADVVALVVISLRALQALHATQRVILARILADHVTATARGEARLAHFLADEAHLIRMAEGELSIHPIARWSRHNAVGARFAPLESNKCVLPTFGVSQRVSLVDVIVSYHGERLIDCAR